MGKEGEGVCGDKEASAEDGGGAGSTDLGAFTEDGVIDATAAAPQALLVRGLSLTRQAEWALVSLLVGEQMNSRYHISYLSVALTEHGGQGNVNIEESTWLTAPEG